MKSSKGWMGRTALVAMLFVAVPVWADEPAKSAEAVYVQGKRLADEGQWEAALSLFKDAYAMDPSPKRAAHLGRAQVMTERFAEGAANLERYLREEKDPPTDVRGAVEELLRRAKMKVATVTLKVDAQGAMLRIDKDVVPAERWGLTQYLEPKTHVFELAKEGFVTTSKTFEFAAGQVAEVELKVGEAVAMPRDAKTSNLGAGMAQKPATRSPLFTAGVIAGGGLVLTGIGVGIGSVLNNGPTEKALNDYNASNAESCDKACLAKLDDYNEKRARLEQLTYAGTILGGVGAAMLVTTLILGKRAAQDRKVGHGSVILVPRVGGIELVGRW